MSEPGFIGLKDEQDEAVVMLNADLTLCLLSRHHAIHSSDNEWFKGTLTSFALVGVVTNKLSAFVGLVTNKFLPLHLE